MDSDTVMIVQLSERDGDAARLVINEAAKWYAEFLAPDEVPDPEMSPEAWHIESERLTWYGAYDGGELIGVVGLEYVADVAASPLVRPPRLATQWGRLAVAGACRTSGDRRRTDDRWYLRRQLQSSPSARKGRIRPIGQLGRSAPHLL